MLDVPRRRDPDARGPVDRARGRADQRPLGEGRRVQAGLGRPLPLERRGGVVQGDPPTTEPPTTVPATTAPTPTTVKPTTTTTAPGDHTTGSRPRPPRRDDDHDSRRRRRPSAADDDQTTTTRSRRPPPPRPARPVAAARCSRSRSPIRARSVRGSITAGRVRSTPARCSTTTPTTGRPITTAAVATRTGRRARSTSVPASRKRRPSRRSSRVCRVVIRRRVT